MQRIILFILSLLLSISCCENSTDTNVSYTDTYKSIQVKEEYKVYGYNTHTRIFIFEIEGHEYIGDPCSNYFIHSPNCNCHKEKETCTSSDFLLQPSWY